MNGLTPRNASQVARFDLRTRMSRKFTKRLECGFPNRSTRFEYR